MGDRAGSSPVARTNKEGEAIASPSLLISEEWIRTFPMRHPGGVSLPPVQKLVASIIVALRGNDANRGSVARTINERSYDTIS